jgi:cyclohexanecarboxyl-CoA dehydrogenase
MSFPFTDQQRELRDAVRAFARAELAPGYLTRARGETFDWDAHRRVADLGVLGLLAGEPHNPLEEEDYVAIGLAIEELAAADFNIANAVIPVLLMSSLLRRHGREWMRRDVLGPLVRGECYVALGLTEPGTGSDVAAITTTATATADGYVIRGEKTSVTMLGESRWIVLVAQTVRDAARVGASVFLVPLDAPGVHTSRMEDTGWRPLGRGVLHLDDVQVGADALVGAEGSAFRAVLGGFDFTRPLLALTGIGCAQSCIDETVDYVRQRPAFGAPLSTYEGVSFPLAEHATRLEAARLLCYSALAHRNRDEPHTALAAMSKWFGPRAAGDTIRDCLLLHGNFGYSGEFPFEQRLRDVLAVEIADGTAQIQKIVIARELFGRDFLPYDR